MKITFQHRPSRYDVYCTTSNDRSDKQLSSRLLHALTDRPAANSHLRSPVANRLLLTKFPTIENQIMSPIVML